MEDFNSSERIFILVLEHIIVGCCFTASLISISSEFVGLSLNFMLYKDFNWTGIGYHISTIKIRLKTRKENKQNKKKKYVYVHLGAAAEGS